MDHVETKYHGLLFRPELINRIQAYQKWQTRRVVSRHNTIINGEKRATAEYWAGYDLSQAVADAGPSPAGNACGYLKVPNRLSDATDRLYPMWQPGDVAYVKEMLVHSDLDGLCYALDGVEVDPPPGTVWQSKRDWVSPIHMARWAARFLMPLVAVIPQRVQECSEKDAIAEGVQAGWSNNVANPMRSCQVTARERWRELWQRVHPGNGPDSWEANPWVWCLRWETMRRRVRVGTQGKGTAQ